MQTPAAAWLPLGLLVATVFSLGCFIVPPPGADGGRDGGVSAAILASARFGLASAAFDQADVYLHRGVDHIRPEAFQGRWFQRTAEALSPRAVVHREGRDSAELVPWLWLTVQMDTTNVEHILVAAYWLDQAGRPELAQKALDEAQTRMPGEPRLCLERARLHLHAGRLDPARRALDAGIACAGDDGDAAPLRASLLLYRGLLNEVGGLTNAACADYRLALTLSQAHHALSERVAALQEGRTTEPSANALLRDLSRTRFRCSHDGDAHSGGLHADPDPEGDR